MVETSFAGTAIAVGTRNSPTSVHSRAQIGVDAPAQFPARRITLNLAPADLPKDGGRFDLAIALGILSASVQVPTLTLDDVECLGELALSGALRAVRGVLTAALAARKAGRSLMVPRENAEEACLASALKVIAVEHLLAVAHFFSGETPLPKSEIESQF